MKLLIIPAILGAFIMSACAPHELLQQQAKEDKALVKLHQAERKEARASNGALAAKAASVAANQNAKTAQQQAVNARKEFNSAVCPVEAE